MPKKSRNANIPVYVDGSGRGETRRPPYLFVGICFVVGGSYYLLIGLGVVAHPNPNAPLNVLGATGFAFLVAGLQFLFCALRIPSESVVSKVVGTVLGVALVAPFAWIALSASAQLDARLIFGGFAVLISLCFFLPIIARAKGIDPATGQALKIESRGLFKRDKL